MNIQTLKSKFSFLSQQKYQRILLLLEVILLTIILGTLSGGKGVDWDESFTHKLVTYNNFLGIIEGTAADVHPPLYYLICRAITYIFGTSLRVFTWVAILSTVGVMLLNSSLVYKRWGFWTAGIMNIVSCLAPVLIYHSINLRMYGWLNFFVFGCVLFGYEVLEDNRWPNWLGLFLFSIGGVYTQYFAVVPIVCVYAYILLHLILDKNKKSFLSFVVVCIGNIVSYVPWLLYASQQFQMDATKDPATMKTIEWSPLPFFEYGFSGKIELSYMMAFILFIIAILLFLICRKSYDKPHFHFMLLLVITPFIGIYMAQYIGALNSHFFNWRYASSLIILIWLVMCIVFSHINPAVYVCFCLWCGLICYNSYGDTYVGEYDSTPLLEETQAFIAENIDPDSILVYDYSTFDTLFTYYMPGHEFIFFPDLDLSTMKGQTFWFIQMGGNYFTEGQIDAYGLEIEHYSGFGYMGMVKFELEKVTVTK